MAKRKRNKQTKRQKVKKRLKMELAEVKARKYKTTFKDIKKFFDTMPKLKHEVEVTNPKTKKKNKIVLQGLSDFFG
mgnify:CR=1 FL=1